MWNFTHTVLLCSLICWWKFKDYTSIHLYNKYKHKWVGGAGKARRYSLDRHWHGGDTQGESLTREEIQCCAKLVLYSFPVLFVISSPLWFSGMLACDSHSYSSTADAALEASSSFTSRHSFLLSFSNGSLSCSFYLFCCRTGTTAAQRISVTNHYSQGKWLTKPARIQGLFYRCFS